MDVELKTVYVANSMPEAEVIRGLLESNGIRCLLQGEAIGQIYGFTGGQLGTVKVMVHQRDLEQARELVKDR